MNRDDIERLRREGISDEAIEHAILVTSFFNYFPRVADGTGIEFDYESPLPRIDVDVSREALPRMPMAEWNLAVDGSTLPAFSYAPRAVSLFEPWRVLHLERSVHLGQTTRRWLARVVAEELCDAAAIGVWKETQPADEVDVRLAAFGRKLTQTPWAMNAGDVQALRSAGLSDEAILGAITLIAYQNAISRMHHGLVAMRG